MIETSEHLNLISVDSMVESFLKDHNSGITTMHHIYFHNDDPLSIRALKAELIDELRTGCVTFLNKNDPQPEELNPYLFYIANSFCKKKAVPQIKKKTEYTCPSCTFLNKSLSILTISNNILKCEICEGELKSTRDPAKISFYRCFYKHNKTGYHCQDCNRFVPHPIDNSPIISCPYLDCCFVGEWSSLYKMNHPTIRVNPERLILDSTQEDGIPFKDKIASEDLNAESILEVKEELVNKSNLLQNIIDDQKGNVPYSSSDFTVKHKLLVYQSFDNLLKTFPDEMVNYLLNQSRSGGFQHKIFQEYIRLLEESFPFNIKKGNKLYKIDNLLDDNLNLFGGISVFDAIVNDKLEIKNNTQEYYIGGRKASYAKPFYLGKILSILEKKSSELLTQKITEYSFSKIKLKEVNPGTEVIVTHLRIPPHYQMGGMVYVNRVRKKIVDRAKFIINKK